MKYMIVEDFKEGKVKELYHRFDTKGRLIPDGLEYIDSWINEDITICFQLMETDNINLLHEWINNWKDVADFKIIPIINSQEAKEKVLSL